MRFIITAQPDRDRAPPDATAGFDEALFVAYMQFNEEMHKAGVLVASEGLNPAAAGARIVAVDGRRQLVDGPFAETKELVGGFYLIDVPSLDVAIQWALRAPCGFGSDDVLEVRQLTGAGDIPPELLRIIQKVAPTWSADVWQRRN